MKTGISILLAGLAIMTAVGSLSAFGGNATVPAIAVVCKADPGVDANAAQQLCDEALVVLQDTYPDRAFQNSDETAPVIRLTVTRATERGVGLAVIWQAADGTQTNGTAMRTSFFDKASDEYMRRTFLNKFLSLNPIPF